MGEPVGGGAAEVLINSAAVAESVRSLEKSLNIPDLISEGSVGYGMLSFDQSLMRWYKRGVTRYDSALFYASNPSEFALRAAGVTAASDRTFADVPGINWAPSDLTRDVSLT